MAAVRRARTPEQKSERRQRILSAALELFEEKNFQQISIDDIARQAGIAKGTIFLYFKTKEALFFNLAADEFAAWFDALDQMLSELAKSKAATSRSRFLDALADKLKERRRMVKLIMILHVFLEHKVGYDDVAAFKRMILKRLEQTGRRIEACLLYLRPGQGFKFLMWMYALVIGFANVAEPAPVVRQVFADDPGLQKMEVDFGEAYFEALGSILDGWQTRNQGSTDNNSI